MLCFSGIPRILTLEPPDRDNAPNISCIPIGEYKCIRVNSAKVNGKETFLVQHVPQREGILFHRGNFEADTEGCILLSLALSRAQSVLGPQSTEGFGFFMELLQGVNEFDLFINSGALRLI